MTVLLCITFERSNTRIKFSDYSESSAEDVDWDHDTSGILGISQRYPKGWLTIDCHWVRDLSVPMHLDLK